MTMVLQILRKVSTGLQHTVLTVPFVYTSISSSNIMLQQHIVHQYSEQQLKKRKTICVTPDHKTAVKAFKLKMKTEPTFDEVVCATTVNINCLCLHVFVDLAM